jgi:hypothetical protein
MQPMRSQEESRDEQTAIAEPGRDGSQKKKKKKEPRYGTVTKEVVATTDIRVIHGIWVITGA